MHIRVKNISFASPATIYFTRMPTNYHELFINISFGNCERVEKMVREAYHTMRNHVPRRAKRGVVRGKMAALRSVRGAYCTSQVLYAAQPISNYGSLFMTNVKSSQREIKLSLIWGQPLL